MGENKRYYWLKLKTDWFSDKRIKKLRSIAGGDTYVIIYLKMMLLSLKDEGKLYYEGVEDNFAAELALDLDESEDNVTAALAFMQAQGLIEVCDSYTYFLTEVPEVIGSETDAAVRKRASRQRMRQNVIAQEAKAPALQCGDNVTPMSQDVTNGHTEIDIDIEKEKRGRFAPPTLCEVAAYCLERKNGIDPQSFIDFYEAKGWYIGKNKMKDWKAAVRTWEQRRKNDHSYVGKIENRLSTVDDWLADREGGDHD